MEEAIEKPRPRRMGPLKADHPLLDGPLEVASTCPGCGSFFNVGEYVTLVMIGPGDDRENRERARKGRPYNAVAIPAHWACVTGEES